jgi:acyl carrier protein
MDSPVTSNDRRMGVELIIAKFWCDLFSMEHVNELDNFFSLGGDSIQATKLANRLSLHFNIVVPIVAIFHSPTVHDLALLIARLQSEGHQSSAAGSNAREFFV